MIRIGNGPNLEVFEISGQQSAEAGLTDLGLNYMCFYCDDIDSALARLVTAGGQALSEVHENRRYEDSEGNGAVYVKAPWGNARGAPEHPRRPLLPRRLHDAGVDARSPFMRGAADREPFPGGTYDEARTIP